MSAEYLKERDQKLFSSFSREEKDLFDQKFEIKKAELSKGKDIEDSGLDMITSALLAFLCLVVPTAMHALVGVELYEIGDTGETDWATASRNMLIGLMVELGIYQSAKSYIKGKTKEQTKKFRALVWWIFTVFVLFMALIMGLQATGLLEANRNQVQAGGSAIDNEKGIIKSQISDIEDKITYIRDVRIPKADKLGLSTMAKNPNNKEATSQYMEDVLIPQREAEINGLNAKLVAIGKKGSDEPAYMFIKNICYTFSSDGCSKQGYTIILSLVALSGIIFAIVGSVNAVIFFEYTVFGKTLNKKSAVYAFRQIYDSSKHFITRRAGSNSGGFMDKLLGSNGTASGGAQQDESGLNGKDDGSSRGVQGGVHSGLKPNTRTGWTEEDKAVLVQLAVEACRNTGNKAGYMLRKISKSNFNKELNSGLAKELSMVVDAELAKGEPSTISLEKDDKPEALDITIDKEDTKDKDK